MRLLSSIFGISLLLLCARWLPSAVVERVRLRDLLATGLISRPVVLCRGKFLITAEHSDSDRQTWLAIAYKYKEAQVSNVLMQLVQLDEVIRNNYLIIISVAVVPAMFVCDG